MSAVLFFDCVSSKSAMTVEPGSSCGLLAVPTREFLLLATYVLIVVTNLLLEQK